MSTIEAEGCQDKVYINGQWVACLNHFDVWDPADGRVRWRAPEADPSLVDLAVRSARNAFTSWKSTSTATRARYMRDFAHRIRAHKDTLARKESMNNGKPIKEAEVDIDDVAFCFEYFANLAEGLDAKQWTPRQIANPDCSAHICYEPVGVVAAVTPWNYPLLMCAWKLAPALAAGCTVILKPSEFTPLTPLDLGVICDEISLPPGVINIISGNGPITGSALINHPDIDKITFTGSVPTGKRMMHAAAEGIKNICLELGGKSAAIIFPTANISRAVEWCMLGCFFTNGQICSATSRVLLHASIADQFVQLLVQETNKLVIGHPLNPNTQVGPLISLSQHQKVLQYIESARSEGGQIAVGGNIPSSSPSSSGYYIEPTVVTGVNPTMKVWREEIFGPVMSIMTFEIESEAIQLANTSEFGLAGAVFSTDEDQLKRVSRQLECGIVWNNCSQPCFSELPWGGTKQSGIGRDLGEEGLMAYLEVKQVVRYVKDDHLGWYFRSKI